MRYQPLVKPRAVKRLNTRARIKPVSAKRRAEMALVAKVFREIAGRDGRCRLAGFSVSRGGVVVTDNCEGDSQPAHLAAWRRSKATGVHTSQSIVRLCAKHHRAYDTHEFDLDYNPTMGADGYLVPVPHKAKGAA